MNFIKGLLRNKRVMIVGVILIVFLGYFGYQKITSGGTAPQYVTSQVEKGTLVVSINGTGQVSSATQIDVKPEASGTITKVYVKSNQEVKAGEALIQLDSRDAEKTVRDASLNLDSAKLSLEKLQTQTSGLSLMQAQSALVTAQTTLEKLKLSQQTDYQNAQDALAKAYEDSFNSVSDTFLDLPTVISAIEDMLYEYNLDSNNQNITYFINAVDFDDRDKIVVFSNSADTDYKTSRIKYDKNFTDYKNTSRYSDNATIESLLSETIETTKTMAQAAKSISNMLDYYVDYVATVPAAVTLFQTDISVYIGEVNTHLSSLLTQQNTLKADKDTLAEMDQNNPLDLAAAEQTVKEKAVALENAEAGTSDIDLKVQEISLQQKENTLADAEEKLADYTVRASFDGIIANLTATLYDTASSGTSIGTLITKQKIAEISLNEVDVAKVQVGQKATLTFDAIENLSITGEVAEIDTIGTASQGVVSYNVKIAFDTNDDRIKPEMSVSADIIIQSAVDVLLIPSSAIKLQDDGTQYVEILGIDGITLTQQTVETGTSDDTSTEITSGLKEGDSIVTQTITSSSKSSSTFGTTPTKESGSLLEGLSGGSGPGGPPQ